MLQVRIDPAALASRGVTISQLSAALRAANQNAPAGSIAESKRDVVLRSVSQFETPEDVARVAIGQGASGPILVGDVAEVVEGVAHGRSFIVEFPSYEAARACYASPAYQAAIELRRDAARFDLVIAEGLEE